MKCQEFTQKKFFHEANNKFIKAVQENDIQALKELSCTTRILHEMNFIKFNIAHTIIWNVSNAIELIKQKNVKVDYKDIVEQITKENENDKQ